MNPSLIATDGGVAGQNPSIYGGSYAYVYVFADGSESWDDPFYVDQGIFDQERQAWVVSNNVTELTAMVRALGGVKQGWYGRVISDSVLTLRRITNLEPSMAGVPDWLVKETARVRKHIDLNRCIWQLVAGHPTDVDLIRGYRMKGTRKVPVSVWNKRADALCTETIARWFPKETRGTVETSTINC